jgi:type IV secretory pathway protease TraF
MTQSRRSSAVEAFLNVVFGFVVSVAANWLILPHYGVSNNLSTSIEIGIWFTFISFARSYILRRSFVWLHGKGILK